MKNQDGMEQTLEALTTNQITRSGEGARMSLEAALIDAEQYRAEVETVNQMTRYCQHCKGPVEECGGQTFVTSYDCPRCGSNWEDTWCCACNDRCPICDIEIEPTSYLQA